jgi:hypothetical protein
MTNNTLPEQMSIADFMALPEDQKQPTPAQEARFSAEFRAALDVAPESMTALASITVRIMEALLGVNFPDGLALTVAATLPEACRDIAVAEDARLVRAAGTEVA